jgi:predicted TIM-barrel fold metal-dependent hydrolase
MTKVTGPILGVSHGTLTFQVPADACDCHVHVFGAAERYAFAPERAYTPGDASIEDLQRLHRTLGLDRVVIVHPSPYGTDNACTVDALRQIGKRARGVAVIDPAASKRDLEAMHKAGVRGVRVNLATAGIADPQVAWPPLQATSQRVASLGWHVQIYTSLAVIDALHDRLLTLPTTLVIDHFGGARAEAGAAQPGFAALLSLVRAGNAYVKLSGGYRISRLPDWSDVPPLARALIEANPERMLWGTDWPHPGGGHRGPSARDSIEPFHAIDDGAALNRLALWAGGQDMLRQILVTNPERLYGF